MKNKQREIELKEVALKPANFGYRKAIGVEIECFSSQEIPEHRLPHWVRKDSDGSIEPNSETQMEAEFRVLSPTHYVDSRITRFCKMLRKHKYYSNESCGLHVHFDMRDKTEEQAVRLGEKIDNWLQTLQGLVKPHRRNGEWSHFGIDEDNKYQAVNVAAYSYHQTIEIRLLEGTTDNKKIKNWIKLIQAIIRTRRRMPRTRSCLGALRELSLEKNVRNYWTNRYLVLNS